jgi:hypothetical protein
LAGTSRAVRVAIALFAIGLAFISTDVMLFFFNDHNTPLWLNLACLLAPLGFAIAIGSALSSGRSEARAAARAVGNQTTS